MVLTKFFIKRKVLDENRFWKYPLLSNSTYLPKFEIMKSIVRTKIE